MLRAFIVGIMSIGLLFSCSSIKAQNINELNSKIIADLKNGQGSFKLQDYQSWQTLYSNKRIVCGILRRQDIDLDKLSDEEYLAYATKHLDRTLYLNYTFFELYYFNNLELIGLGIINSGLNNSPGKKLKVTFTFDNGLKKSIFGYVPNYKAPWVGEFIKNPSSRMMIGFPHKEFYREILPFFKSRNKVYLSVNGKSLDTFSLKGFTNAFNRFNSCMNGKVKIDLYDPF